MTKTITLECGCEVEASYDWVNGEIEMGILNNCINEYRNIQQHAEDAEARADALQAEVERLRAALSMIEWGNLYMTERCPWCMGVRTDYPYMQGQITTGHTHDCPRQKALGL